jgi:hypothetical protein
MPSVSQEGSQGTCLTPHQDKEEDGEFEDVDEEGKMNNSDKNSRAIARSLPCKIEKLGASN